MQNKIIGTSIPLFSLRSKQTAYKPNGTIQDGILFLDWLKKTNQSAWQMLPLHETQLIPGSKSDHIASPYKGYGIGIDPKYLPDNHAYHPTPDEISDFKNNNRDWLEDYSLFCALRDRFGTDDWTVWEEPIRIRNTEVLDEWKKKLAQEIESYSLTQCLLHISYRKLRDQAKNKSIMLFGDLPFYIPLRSPLVWKFQRSFQITESLPLRYVSGVPQRPHEWYGRQVWGHPLYTWSDVSLYTEILDLWKLRLRYAYKLYDAIRFDHAAGFYHYGRIDLTDPAKDQTISGPGSEIYTKLIKYCQAIHLLTYAEEGATEAEDLLKATKEFKIPGMRVFVDIYNPLTKRIENLREKPVNYPVDCIAYTSTHDTKTLIGFLQDLDNSTKEKLAREIGIPANTDDIQLALSIRESVISSPARIVLLPIQDWLLSAQRINIPGTEKETGDPNWQYRMPIPIEKLPLELF